MPATRPLNSREATSIEGQTHPDVSSEALHQEDSLYERRASLRVAVIGLVKIYKMPRIPMKAYKCFL
jgi:hypothetical protein